MKIHRLLLASLLLASLVACSAPKAPPFELVEAVLYSGDTLEALDLSRTEAIAAREGDKLVLRFSQPLGQELPAGFTLKSDDTRSLVVDVDPVVIIPQGIKNASGKGLAKEYRFNFKLEQAANPPTWNYNDWVHTRSYLDLNGRTLYFDPLTIKELVVPGQGTVFVNIGGTHHRREVRPGVTAINIVDKDVNYSLPVRYLPELGFNPVLRLSLTHFSELGMNFGCSFPVRETDYITLHLLWPFLREDVEVKVRAALGDSLLALEWISDTQCNMVVQGKRGDAVDLGVGYLTDIYGYIHESEPYMESYSTHFTLRFQPDSLIVVRDNEGKELRRYNLPLYVDGASKYNPEKKQVHLYKLQPFESPLGEHYYLHEFVYDLSEGCIIGSVAEGTQDFPPIHRTAYRLIKDRGPEGGLISHLALSPSGKAAGLFRLPTGNKMVVYDPASDTTARFDLVSSNSNDGGGPPPEQMHWSADETYLVYGLWYENNEPGIYVLNTKTGAEQKVFEGDAAINSVSPYGEHLIVSSYAERASGWYYQNSLVDFEGNKRLLDNLDQAIGVTAWLSNDGFLAVRYSTDPNVLVESLMYDLSDDTVHPLGPGHVFGCDPDLEQIYILIHK